MVRVSRYRLFSLLIVFFSLSVLRVSAFMHLSPQQIAVVGPDRYREYRRSHFVNLFSAGCFTVVGLSSGLLVTKLLGAPSRDSSPFVPFLCLHCGVISNVLLSNAAFDVGFLYSEAGKDIVTLHDYDDLSPYSVSGTFFSLAAACTGFMFLSTAPVFASYTSFSPSSKLVLVPSIFISGAGLLSLSFYLTAKVSYLQGQCASLLYKLRHGHIRIRNGVNRFSVRGGDGDGTV